MGWDEETTKRFDQAYRKAGYRSRAHFFDVIGRDLIHATEADIKLVFPAKLQIEKTPPPEKKPRQKRSR